MIDRTHRIVITEELHVAYEEHGSAGGRPIVLFHGWPDDGRTWDGVAPALAADGWRVIVPWLRGFGPTRFRDPSAPRTGQITALANDARQLLDAIGIERATAVGHDWGARLSYVLAALWPERVERLVTMSVPYQTGIPSGAKLDYRQAHAHWYQWFFASDRGREALQGNRRELCRYLWHTWAPDWHFTAAELEATAAAWDNPDWVDITLHSYRVRWGNAPQDPRFAELEERMKKHPIIEAPTVQLHGADDGASLADAATAEEQAKSFSGGFRREILPGVGHFVPRERPEAILRAIANPPG